VRVIAGEKRGQQLQAPPGRSTRPTSDRVREAAFSMLASLDVVEEARVWDMFAGSGAIGIEALSRGAAHVTFVEQARDAVSAVRVNLAKVGYGPHQATVVVADVLSWVGVQTRADVRRRSAAAPGDKDVVAGAPATTAPVLETVSAPRVDLVSADPPYAWQGWDALLGYLAPLDPLLMAETGEKLELPGSWRALRSKRYGGTVVTLARPLRTDEAEYGSE
jgi:16S rRNA (guanine966-N2)-methyltransferase